jgi:cell division protein FtsL
MDINKKNMITFICICIGAIITIIAAFVDYRNKLAEERQNLIKERQRSDEYKNIVNKSNNIIESQRSVINATEKITQLQTELDLKNKKIQELQNQTLDNITGGESYSMLLITYENKENTLGRLSFELGPNCKHPLQHVQSRIVDLNDNSVEFNFDVIQKTTFSIGTIEPHQISVLNSFIKLDKTKGVNLIIYTSANNGFYTQVLRMKFINNKWSKATIVYRDRDAKELYCKIDSTYPNKDKKTLFKE